MEITLQPGQAVLVTKHVDGLSKENDECLA